MFFVAEIVRFPTLEVPQAQGVLIGFKTHRLRKRNPHRDGILCGVGEYLFPNPDLPRHSE